MWRKYIVSSSRHHHNHILCMCIMCCSNGWTGRFPHGIVWGLAVGTFRRLLCLSYAYNEFLQADAGWADVLHGAETADDVDRPGTVLWRCELCRTQVYPAASLVLTRQRVKIDGLPCSAEIIWTWVWTWLMLKMNFHGHRQYGNLFPLFVFVLFYCSL